MVDNKVTLLSVSGVNKILSNQRKILTKLHKELGIAIRDNKVEKNSLIVFRHTLRVIETTIKAGLFTLIRERDTYSFYFGPVMYTRLKYELKAVLIRVDDTDKILWHALGYREED